MRGKRNRFWCLGYANRNIPAYAGKTSIPHNLFCPLMEHPRVCGENPIIPAAERGHDGTSPRMRGKRVHTDRSGELFRNIPAYAGKTRVANPCKPRVWEHPRVCGENAVDHGGLVVGVGNIPAYAGKTAAQTLLARRTKEHPRVCGENICFLVVCGGNHGTSPRMRGKQTQRGHHHA